MTIYSNYFYFGIKCNAYEFLKAEIKLRSEQGLLSFEKNKFNIEYNPEDDYKILEQNILENKLELNDELEEIFNSNSSLYDVKYNFKQTKIIQKYKNIKIGAIPFCYYKGKIIVGVFLEKFMIAATKNCSIKHKDFPRLPDDISEEIKKQVIKDVLEIFPDKNEEDFNYFQIPNDCDCCS
jgi:hypothetical protein